MLCIKAHSKKAWCLQVIDINTLKKKKINFMGQNVNTCWYTVRGGLLSWWTKVTSGSLPTSPVQHRTTPGLWCHTLAGTPWLLCSKLWWWFGSAPVLPCPVKTPHTWEILGLFLGDSTITVVTLLEGLSDRKTKTHFQHIDYNSHN